MKRLALVLGMLMMAVAIGALAALTLAPADTLANPNGYWTGFWQWTWSGTQWMATWVWVWVTASGGYTPS